MPPVLTVDLLRKTYPGKPPFVAVDDISFMLKKGEILGLLGPNGSGKTTTVQMLLGTLTCTRGSISYFGKNFFSHRSEILQSISFASTYTSLPWLLTIMENLVVVGHLYGLSKMETIRRCEPLLDRFDILEKKNHRISSLSAGQITRLMLVKAFFTQPKIVLLDEPTASLDPDIAKDICLFLLEQREENGLSIIFSSHKMDEVMEICDRSIFLKKGKIIADDIPQKLAKSVSTFYVIFTITEGLEKLIALIKKYNLTHKQDHRFIEICMKEETIPEFLRTVNQEGIVYTNIKIEEPSLEDFFLQIAKKL